MLAPAYDIEWSERVAHVQEDLRHAALSVSSGVTRKSYADLLFGNFSNDEASFALLEGQLAELSVLVRDWDSYGAPAPTVQSIANAKRAIGRLRFGKVLPEAVVPSAEGGVSIYFSRGSQKTFIEFSNDGEVLLACYGKDDEPNVNVLPNGLQDLNDQVLQEIRNHLGARA